ncbi:MAG: SIS domain-containing protein [Armatimonadota bacterium]
MEQIKFYLRDVGRILEALSPEQIQGLVDRVLGAYDEGRQVFLLGNGGSASTCSHIVNDFQKCIYFGSGKTKTFKCMSLTDNVALMTAWANDTAYDQIFAEQLRPWVQPGDLVFCVSGSGNSPNVLNAARLAREMGAYTVGLTGFQGGKLAPLVDEPLVVPSDNMQRIEDAHMIILHLIFWRMLHEVEARRAAAE